MMYVGAEQTYSENGWTVTYHKIGANYIYLSANKTVSSIGLGANQLEAATLPFKAALNQRIPLYMNVAGDPVGYGNFRFVPRSDGTTAMYRNNTEYGAPVNMLVEGALVVAE